MPYFYEAAAIDIEWNGVDLSTGWAEDVYITITPNSDHVTHKSGADGKYTFSKMADKGCTISMEFTDVADVNKAIAKISAIQDAIGAAIPIAPFTLVDRTGDSVHFAALNAVLTKVPEITFGNASQTRTWEWVCETYLMAEDPTTITSQIQDYLKL